MSELIPIPNGYADLLEEIVGRIARSRPRAALAVSRELVLLYWSIGAEILVRQKAEGWGSKVIDRLGRDLQARFPGVEGFSPRSLRYMRALADAWPDPAIVPHRVALLPWGHLRLLLDRVKDPVERDWYLGSQGTAGRTRSVHPEGQARFRHFGAPDRLRLRRNELAMLDVETIQMREGRWVLADLCGKGRRIRKVAVPLWVKQGINAWMTAAKVEDGRLLRSIAKGGKLGKSLTDWAVWSVVEQSAKQIGIERFGAHDLRRTCAKLCRKAGGDLEQIKFLLGHSSIQTTERYLGSEQEIAVARKRLLGALASATALTRSATQSSAAMSTEMVDVRGRQIILLIRCFRGTVFHDRYD